MQFMLITEGVSENRIIKKILSKYFDPEPFFGAEFPEQNLITGKQTTESGGWNEVLKYIQIDENLKAAFVENDYVVIQIDTDQSQQLPFDINHNKEDNSPKSIEELYLEVVEKLRSLINAEILQEFGDKIIFAISIHSIECWFLPIYFDNNDRAKTTGCIDKLNRKLKKIGRGLPKGNKNDFEAQKTYAIILKNWSNKKSIIDSAKHNFAFNRFIEDLDAIEVAP